MAGNPEASAAGTGKENTAGTGKKVTEGAKSSLTTLNSVCKGLGIIDEVECPTSTRISFNEIECDLETIIRVIEA